MRGSDLAGSRGARRNTDDAGYFTGIEENSHSDFHKRCAVGNKSFHYSPFGWTSIETDEDEVQAIKECNVGFVDENIVQNDTVARV
jgi:hypothetical protein